MKTIILPVFDNLQLLIFRTTFNISVEFRQHLKLQATFKISGSLGQLLAFPATFYAFTTLRSHYTFGILSSHPRPFLTRNWSVEALGRVSEFFYRIYQRVKPCMLKQDLFQ
jgi:hypothetical protein